MIEQQWTLSGIHSQNDYVQALDQIPASGRLRRRRAPDAVEFEPLRWFNFENQ